MDKHSPLKDQSICSSVCWKWKIRLCPVRFRSLWNQTNNQRRNSLLLTAQQSPIFFKCQRSRWMSWISRNTTHQMKVEEDWYQLWSTAEKLCKCLIHILYFCQDHYRQRWLTIIIQFGLEVWFCSGQELPAHPFSLAWIRTRRAAIIPQCNKK